MALTLRKLMIEAAWLWLRHQPDSALSAWFRAKVGNAKGRIKRRNVSTTLIQPGLEFKLWCSALV